MALPHADNPGDRTGLNVSTSYVAAPMDGTVAALRHVRRAALVGNPWRVVDRIVVWAILDQPERLLKPVDEITRAAQIPSALRIFTQTFGSARIGG